MNKKLLTLSVLGALTAGCADPETPAPEETATAAETAPAAETVVAAPEPDGADKPAGSAALETLAAAADLQALAIEQQDALLLAAAIRLQQSVPTEAIEVEVTETGDEATDKPTAAELTELALQFAGENEDLLAVVDMATTGSTARGDVQGAAGYYSGRVLANGESSFNITFEGGEPAMVMIVGDGDTDLDMFVTDAYGNEICSGLSYTDRETCGWVVEGGDSQYTVRVTNLGDVWNAVKVYTN